MSDTQTSGITTSIWHQAQTVAHTPIYSDIFRIFHIDPDTLKASKTCLGKAHLAVGPSLVRLSRITHDLISWLAIYWPDPLCTQRQRPRDHKSYELYVRSAWEFAMKTMNRKGNTCIKERCGPKIKISIWL